MLSFDLAYFWIKVRITMKILTAVLALICFSGGSAFARAQSEAAQDSNGNVGLSDYELNQVRERLPCLKPGMVMKEVFDVLGIDLHARAYAEWGSGTADDYSVVYQLAPVSNEHGYNLIIVNGRELKFKRAEIVCLIESNECAEDNEKAKDNQKGCPNESEK